MVSGEWGGEECLFYTRSGLDVKRGVGVFTLLKVDKS